MPYSPDRYTAGIIPVPLDLAVRAGEARTFSIQRTIPWGDVQLAAIFPENGARIVADIDPGSHDALFTFPVELVDQLRSGEPVEWVTFRVDDPEQTFADGRVLKSGSAA